MAIFSVVALVRSSPQIERLTFGKKFVVFMVTEIYGYVLWHLVLCGWC